MADRCNERVDRTPKVGLCKTAAVFVCATNDCFARRADVEGQHSKGLLGRNGGPS